MTKTFFVPWWNNGVRIADINEFLFLISSEIHVFQSLKFI